MGALDTILIPSLRLEEIASDGSTLTNPAADSRRLFLGEDGLLHLKDSAGTVTDITGGGGSGSITASGYTQSTARLLGRTTASAGAIEEITVGSGLTLSAGSLSASGTSGAPELPIDAAATASVGSGDLFGGTSLDGGWSSLQATALTANDRSVDGYLIQQNTGNTGGKDRGLQRAFAPAGDFTVYAKVSFATIFANYQWLGLFVGAADPSDGGSGNRVQLMIVQNNGVHLKAAKMAAGSETGVLDVLTSETGAGTLGSAGTNSTAPRFPLWLRIKRAGSTISFGVTWDGVQFVDHATTTTIAFTVATIGLFIGESSATTNIRGTFAYIATTG